VTNAATAATRDVLAGILEKVGVRRKGARKRGRRRYMRWLARLIAGDPEACSGRKWTPQERAAIAEARDLIAAQDGLDGPETSKEEEPPHNTYETVRGMVASGDPHDQVIAKATLLYRNAGATEEQARRRAEVALALAEGDPEVAKKTEEKKAPKGAKKDAEAKKPEKATKKGKEAKAAKAEKPAKPEKGKKAEKPEKGAGKPAKRKDEVPPAKGKDKGKGKKSKASSEEE